MAHTPRPHRPPGSTADPDPELRVRLTRPEDIPRLIALSREIYAPPAAWLTRELRSHQEIFPEGQVVVVDRRSGAPLGMAVSLVISNADWPLGSTWAEITADGRLVTHDPEGGDTLYGAGVAVHPHARGRGVGRMLYAAREALLHRMGLERIRAAARIPGFASVAEAVSAPTYVDEVVQGHRRDPALSFHLHMGFRVIAVVPGYLPDDRNSRGWAAVVEWTPA